LFFADFVGWMLNCPWLTVFVFLTGLTVRTSLSHPKTLSHPGMGLVSPLYGHE
jgi:hypothetical protein